jgi:hypothetical protein
VLAILYSLGYYSAMTKISELKHITDPIKAAEAEHDGSKIALRISPLATFLLEAGLYHRIGGSKTRAATVLFEAAIQDWAESQGIDISGEDFRGKYKAWLTRQPLTVEGLDAWDLDDAQLVRAVERGEVYPLAEKL